MLRRVPNPKALLTSLALLVVLASLAHASDQELRLRNELGIIHARNGQLEESLRYFTLNLAMYPNDVAALNNSANIYLMQGETERALELYQRAVDTEPEQGGVYLNLGIVHHMLGNADQSKVYIREGMQRVGDVTEAYYLLGISGSPQDGRASDEAGLRDVEIEQLLAEAMTEVPQAKEEEKAPVEVAEGSKQVETRSGGTKAAKIDAGPDRLFWMEIEGDPSP